jgi:hypothetical protein
VGCVALAAVPDGLGMHTFASATLSKAAGVLAGIDLDSGADKGMYCNALVVVSDGLINTYVGGAGAGGHRPGLRWVVVQLAVPNGLGIHTV